MVNNKLTIPMEEMIPLIRSALCDGKPVEMTVTGRSMLPLLRDRLSSVRLIRPENLTVGDVVLFRRADGHYVLHRICAVHDGLYDILGDRLPAPDKDVPGSEIIARVAEFNRRGTHWRKSDRLYRFFLPGIRFALYCGRAARQKLSPKN